MERTVHEPDRVLVGAGLEAIRLEDVHHGAGPSLRAGRVPGSGGEFFAEFAGTPVERCSW
jgi:hypothetical protein